jgi:integrase
MSPNGLYRYASALRALLRNIETTSGLRGLVELLPKPRRPGPRRTIAAPREIDALLRAAPTWQRVIILLAAHAGFRRSDCLRVAPVHYNAERRTITIDQKKTGETVTVPVTDTLARVLEAAPDGPPTTPFYELHKGSPISYAGVDSAWQALKKKTGVNPNLWLHDLRRTLAVSVYDISKDLRAVEQLLGHQSLRSTTEYLEHRDPQKLRPYLDALFIPKGRVQ